MLRLERLSAKGAPGVAGDARVHQHVGVALPAVDLEEVGDAADGVGAALLQVDVAVAVEVDRVARACCPA